tara:strand:- start:69 stop:266 length:198 start_codon:yes stop_codon:yes gene_type:complete
MSDNPLPSNVEFDRYQKISVYEEDYTHESDEEYNENYSFLKKNKIVNKNKTNLNSTILKPETYLD